jgi:GH35 family endo-1,4-beta-xylanase
MNNKEIYINGILVDLDEAKSPIRLTYAINDLAELKDRQAYSSNVFKLPKTARNLMACGLPDNANLIQEQPYRKNSARIVQNGIEIIPSGIAVINGSGAAIEVQILSGLIGFFDSLGDKKIRDLDLSLWDHTWDLETVVQSQIGVRGYLYPVIDYGGLVKEEKRRADVRQLRPATFRRTIIQQIIREAGYDYEGAVFSDDKFNRSIVPFSNDKFEHGPSFVKANAKVSASAKSTLPRQLDINTKDYVLTFQDYKTTDPGKHWNGTEYTATDVARVNVKLEYDLTVYDLSKTETSGVYIRFQINRGAGWETIPNGEDFKPQGEDFKIYSWKDQVFQLPVDINPGDKIRAAIHITEFAFGTFMAGAVFSIEYLATEVIYGQQVQLAATLPDITQKNFFKDFLQNFGLIAIPDPYKKNIVLLNMADVYQNKDLAEDITSKLIDSPDEISYSLSGYGINNLGKYKPDEAVPDGTGDGNLVLDNLTLNENVTMFTSVFAASKLVNRLSGLEVVEIKKIEDITKSAEFKIKTEPRILLHHEQNTIFEFYDDASSRTVGTISLPTFDGLEYGTLFQDNYWELKKMLYRPFVVKKPILLKAADVADINWRVPVYDAKSASYYYKNQIEYLEGDISTISLIRLGDLDTEKFSPDPIITVPEIPDEVDPPGEVDPPVTVATTLKQKFPYRVGVAFKNALRNDDQYCDIVEEEFDQATPENACKFGKIRPNRATFSFTELDNNFNVARDRGLKIHLHYLLPGGDDKTIQWFLDMETLPNAAVEVEAEIRNHIKTVLQYVMSTYPDMVVSIDIVNECLTNGGNVKDSMLRRLFGEQYIDMVIDECEKWAPGIPRLLNDFDFEYNSSRISGVIALRQRIAARGYVLHGIGSQMHSVLRLMTEGLTDFRNRIKMIADSGMMLHISELDVRCRKGTNNVDQGPYPFMTPQLEAAQADFFVQVHQAVIDFMPPANILAVTVWSLDDNSNFENIPTMTDYTSIWYLQNGIYKKRLAHKALLDIPLEQLPL